MDNQDSIQAVAIIPPEWIKSPADIDPTKRGMVNYKNIPIPREMFEAENQWPEVPITTRLGFPLKLIRVVGENDDRYNDCVAALYPNIDVGFSSFGGIVIPPHVCRGTFLAVRCDGEDLDWHQFHVFFDYINESFGDAYTPAFQGLSEELKESMKEDIRKKLTANAFAIAYKKSRRSKIAAGDKLWESLACPVRVEGSEENCEVCGAKEANLCSGWKKIRYCSKACQKKDWKAHKGACKAAEAEESEDQQESAGPTTSS